VLQLNALLLLLLLCRLMLPPLQLQLQALQEWQLQLRQLL
jgi:hypothetical protein